MSLGGLQHKLPFAGLALVRVCSRAAVGCFSRTVRVAVTAARRAARQRGRGRCERPSDVIARARKVEWPGASRLAGGENVSGSSCGSHLEMVLTNRARSRAWVISKGVPRPLAEKNFVVGLAVT